MKNLLLTLAFLAIAAFCYGQKIDSLKLPAQDIPTGYSELKELKCKSIQATLLYENPEMYSAILGSVVKKDFQSFKSKKDVGSILYFEFENDVKGAAFLNGLLWGQDGKPTKHHPETYIAKKNILIIWSFNDDSQIRKVSLEKVSKLLQ